MISGRCADADNDGMITANGRIGLDINDVVFDDSEIILAVDYGLHPFGIFSLGALCACRLDGWSSTQVQRFDLQCGAIGIASHLASESIDLVDQVAFGKSAN